MAASIRRFAFPLLALLILSICAAIIPSVALGESQAGTTLVADVTASGWWTRTFPWAVSKTASPTNLSLFSGDSGETRYTVALTKGSGVDEGSFQGVVGVTNGGSVATDQLTIVVQVTAPPSTVVLGSANVDTSVHPVLQPGETYGYPYRVATGDVTPGGQYKVTANVTIMNHSGSLGTPKGPSPSGDASLPVSPTLVNDTVHVSDSNGSSWAFGSSGAVSYTETFGYADQGVHTNTATIQETGHTASASVTVNAYDLSVATTAATSLTRTYLWTIGKTAAPNVLNLFQGDTGTVQYNVAVTNTGSEDSNWVVAGAITVANPAPIAATLAGVSDVVSGGVAAAVDCGVSFPYTLAPGATLSCSYGASLPDGTARTNNAVMTLQNHRYDSTGGATASGTTAFHASAAVDFTSATVTPVNQTVHVSDSYGGSWAFSGSGAQSYAKTFTYANHGRQTNTATIEETGQSAWASVIVNNFALQVSQTASPSFTRTYNWTIAKTANHSSVTLALNEQLPVTYTVSVNYAGANSNWAVNGTINIVNPAPVPVTLAGVSELISPGIAATVSGATFPYAIPAGGTLVLKYSAGLPDATTRTATATAQLQNVNYGPSGATAGGMTSFAATTAVSFASAGQTDVNKCITVADSMAGTLGNLCAGSGSFPKLFTYRTVIGPYTASGSYTVPNVASYTVNGSGLTPVVSGSATWSVTVNVPASGCTLTIGYWKTHAGFGPQPNMVSRLLPQWLGTASGLKSVAVTTNSQVVTILGMKLGSPSNGITKLYAQLLGAKLNIASGASPAAVTTAMSAADAFLATRNQLNWTALSKSDKNNVLSWASALDNYNNGLIGPGHCTQ